MFDSTIDFTIYKFPPDKNPDDKTRHVNYYKSLQLDPYTALSQLARMIETQEAQAIGAQPVLSKYEGEGRVYTDKNPKHFRKQSECLENHIQLVTLDLEISKTLENLPGYDNIKRFRSVEEVVQFVNSLGVENCMITKSASHMRGDNDYKWHVYFVLNRPVSTQEVIRWLWHRLPAETWVKGLSKDGRAISTNSMVDLSIFNATMTSHEYAHKESPVVYLKDGATPFRIITPRGINKVTEPYHRPMFSEREKRKTSILHRRKQSPAQRRHMKHIDATGTIPPEFLLYPNHGSTGFTAQAVKEGKCKYKNFRDPYDPEYNGGPLHHQGNGVFHHYRLGLMLTIDDRPPEEVINYESKYAPLPEKLTDTNCLIISETGSGKTFSAQKWKKSIFIVPTKALQRDIQKNYPEANIMRSSRDSNSNERDSMDLLSPFALNVMTYDKLAGFIMEGKRLELLERYNIIIDEVHKLVQGHEDKHHVLYKSLFKREVKFQKLCLLSATVEPSVLKVPELKVYRYVSQREYKAYVTRIFPYDKIQTGQKVFVYRQSTQGNAELLEVCKSRGLKAIAIRGGEADVRVDVPEDIDTYDVIIGTSTIDVGVSFTHHIDTVIVDNVKGAIGLAAGPSEIIQIVSRVRNNIPAIYIKHASTHYGNIGLDEGHPDRINKPVLASYLLQAQTNEIRDPETLALLKRFREQEHIRSTQRLVIPDVKQVDDIEWSEATLAKSMVQYTELGTINMFLKRETSYLLADWDAAKARYWKEGRIKIEMLGPQAVESEEVLELEAQLKGKDLPTYTRHKHTRKGIEEEAKGCTTYAQLKAFLDKDWDLAYYKNLQKTLLATEPIEQIEMEGMQRKLKESIQVQSITTRSVRQDLKRHRKNLLEGYYKLFSHIDKNEKYSLKELRNKTIKVGVRLTGSQKRWTSAKMLEKLREVIRYEMLDDNDKVVKQKPKCTQIRVLKAQLYDTQDIFEMATPQIG